MSKIYHGERIVNETIGLEKLKPEVTEQLGGETIESLTTDGNNLVLTTSNGVLTTDLSDVIGVTDNSFELERTVLKQGEETIDLLPAIRVPFTPREDWPDVIKNHDFTNTTSGNEIYQLRSGTFTEVEPNRISFNQNIELVITPIYLPPQYRGEIMVEIRGSDGRYTFNFSSSPPEYTIDVIGGVGRKKARYFGDYFRLHIYANPNPGTITSVLLYKINSEQEVYEYPSLITTLEIDKTNLVVNTNNTAKRVDLTSALQAVLDIPEQLTNLLRDPNFQLTFESGASPWFVQGSFTSWGNGVIQLGPNTGLVQTSVNIREGVSYDINMLTPNNGARIGLYINNSNPEYATFVSGGKAKITFIAPFTAPANIYLSANQSITYTEITLSETLTPTLRNSWPSLVQSGSTSGSTLILSTNNGDKLIDLSALTPSYKPSIVSETNTDTGGTIVFAPNIRTNKPERYEYRTTDSFGYTSHWISCESFTITLGNSNYALGGVEIREKENTFTGTEASESTVNTVAFTAVEGANTLYAARVEGLYVSFSMKNNTDGNTYVDILRGSTGFDIVGRTAYAQGFMIPTATPLFGPLEPGNYRAASNSGAGVSSNVISFTVQPLPMDLDPDRVLDFSLDTQARNIHLLTDKFEATLDISLLLPTDDLTPRISDYSDEDNYLIFLPNGRSPLATAYEYQTIHEGFTSEWMECESFTIFLGNGNYALDSVRIRERALSDGSRPATDFCTNTLTFTQKNDRNTLKPVHVSGRTAEFKFMDTTDGNSYVKVEGVTNGFQYQSRFYGANNVEANTGFVDWGWPAGKYRAYINSGSSIRSNIEYFTIPGTPTPHVDRTPDRVEVFEVSGNNLVLQTDKAGFTLPLSALNAPPLIPLEIVAPVGSDYMHYVLDRPIQISSSKSVRNIAGFDYQVVAGATNFPIRNNITAVNTDLATLSPAQISAGYTLGVQIIRTDATKPSFALINING